jgi:hypothetical protein
MTLWDFIQSNIIAQVVAAILPLIVTALLTWAAILYARITGKELEAKHREALQSALTNGLNWAIQQVLSGKLSKDGTVPESQKAAVVAKAQQYVTSSVPDAVRKFQLSQTTMEKLIEAKLPNSAPKSLTEN